MNISCDASCGSVAAKKFLPATENANSRVGLQAMPTRDRRLYRGVSESRMDEIAGLSRPPSRSFVIDVEQSRPVQASREKPVGRR